MDLLCCQLKNPPCERTFYLYVSGQETEVAGSSEGKREPPVGTEPFY